MNKVFQYITFSIGFLGMLFVIQFVFTKDWYSLGNYILLVVGTALFSGYIIESLKLVLSNK